jgi:predicted component of type VI protein secretion system
MQPSLLHRFKNKKQCERDLYYSDNRDRNIINTLIADLFILFSTRPLLSGVEGNEIICDSVLNYGVRVVDNSRVNGSREFIQKKIEENILHAIRRYEKRLCNVTIEQCSSTAEKISFKVGGVFLNISVLFIVSWEISSASYSLNVVR